MSEFPRGWTVPAQASAGSEAVATVPGIAGVVHVLDSFTAKAQAGGAGSGFGCSVVLSSSDGVFNNFVLGVIEVSGPSSSDECSASGLDLAAGPGASLSVGFNVNAPAGDNETVLIQGHDI